jgi:transposase
MKSVAGIDVSKASLDVCFREKTKTFDNDLAGHRALMRWCKGAELVVMEATGSYHFDLACALHEKGFSVAVVNPARACYYAKSMGKRNKTDSVDAGVLAEFGRTHELELFVPPSEGERSLCRLVRLRSDLVVQRAQGKIRVQDPAVTEFERVMWEAQELFLNGQIAVVEKEITKVLASEEALTAAYDLLLGIPGVGAVTAWTILAEVRDIKRFDSAKKIAAFAGVCPSLRQSGTSLKGPGKLSRQGNSTLRKALYMAAVAAIRLGGAFQDFFVRLVSQGKAKKTALVAVMHKLIRTAYGVLKSGDPFIDKRALTTP